jgi:hypothetical protein
MFSKLVDNKLAVPFLEQHCRYEYFHACEDIALIRENVGGEGFLWGKHAAAKAHNRRAWVDEDGDYSRLVRRIVQDRPVAVASFMFRDTLVLASRPTLVSGDGRELQPRPDLFIPRLVSANFPRDAETVFLARQQQGTLIGSFPKEFYYSTAGLSLLLSVISLWSFAINKERLLFTFSLSITLGAVFAIALHGALSDPWSRYHVKFSWLICIPAALWVLNFQTWRTASCRREPSG